MKKTGVICLALCVAALTFAHAQNFKGGTQKSIVIAPPQKSLDVGERLEYSIEWLGIPIAQMELSTQGIVSVNNRQCYHIHGKTTPNNFFRRIYDAEYAIDTYLDVQTLQPLRFEKMRKVKGTVTCVTLEFDHQNHQAKYGYYAPSGSATVYNFFAKMNESVASNSSMVSAPAGSQDVFSALYYFRLLDIAPQKNYPMAICYGDKNWSMVIRVGEPFWKEIRKRGTLAVFEARPSSDLNSYLLGNRKIALEFSADAKRTLLEFSLGTKVGELRGILKTR